MNKKGIQIIDIMTNPVFVTVVAIGLCLIYFLGAIDDMASSKSFEKQHQATSAGLLIDSMYVPPPETNFIFSFPLKKNFGFSLKNQKAIVFEKNLNDGKSFFFTQDPAYHLKYVSISEKKNKGKIYFAKSGNNLQVSHKPFNLTNDVFCSYRSKKELKKIMIDVDDTLFSSRLLGYHSVFSEDPGDAVLSIGLKDKKDNNLIIYVNDNKESEQLACLLAQSIVEKFPSTKGLAIVPIDATLLPPTDRRKILDTSQPAVFIDIGGTTDNPFKNLDAVAGAIAKGVTNYGVKS